MFVKQIGTISKQINKLNLISSKNVCLNNEDQLRQTIKWDYKQFRSSDTVWLYISSALLFFTEISTHLNEPSTEKKVGNALRWISWSVFPLQLTKVAVCSLSFNKISIDYCEYVYKDMASLWREMWYKDSLSVTNTCARLYGQFASYFTTENFSVKRMEPFRKVNKSGLHLMDEHLKHRECWVSWWQMNISRDISQLHCHGGDIVWRWQNISL